MSLGNIASIADIADRSPPVPWQDGAKIPWDDPAFSTRMLREHLSQEHDRASRRFAVIDEHVGWIHEHVLGNAAGSVLDLGCGPGLYTSRLARLGHTCVGLDFSPASIEHARSEAEREGLACEYRQHDLRAGGYGTGLDMTLLVFGELNAFPPLDATTILGHARDALRPDGVLVLEVHREHRVRELGQQTPRWFTSDQSVFSDTPHVCLQESAWDDDQQAAVERYFVIDVRTHAVATYTCTTQAYSDDAYEVLVRGAGFTRFQRHSGLSDRASADDGLFVIVAYH